MNLEQFDEHIVKPTLNYINMGGLAARQLMLGTAMVESGFEFIKQIGGGPALSFYQIEPSTYYDNYENYLDYPGRKHLKNLFIDMRSSMPIGADQLICNLCYATAHARLKYYRSPKPLPKEFDYKAMAKYHKEIYNTVLGATDISKSEAFFKTICERIVE